MYIRDRAAPANKKDSGERRESEETIVVMLRKQKMEKMKMMLPGHLLYVNGQNEDKLLKNLLI